MVGKQRNQTSAKISMKKGNPCWERFGMFLLSTNYVLETTHMELSEKQTHLGEADF